MALKQHMCGNYLLLAPSQGGKSTFMKKVIDEKDTFFDHPIKNIMYIYSTWNQLYNEYAKNKNIQLHKGIPNEAELDNFLSLPGFKIIVLDDVMLHMKDHLEKIQKLFTLQSHHKKTNVFYLTQSMHGNDQKIIQQNCHYFILFKTRRLLSQIKSLGMQLGIHKELKSAYKSTVLDGSNYSYLVVCVHPGDANNDRYMIRTNIFKNEDTAFHE